MNTPPTRKRKLRYSTVGKPPFGSDGGNLSSGIHSGEMQAAFARAISFWPFVEDGMSNILLGLIGVEHGEIASEIFHALIAQNTRLPVMRSLLQNTQFNADKPEDFDALLDDFKDLNDQRNRYVHGYWFTDESTGRAYLCKSNQDPMRALFNGGRHVDVEELEKFSADCFSLFKRSLEISADAIRANRERRG